MGKASEQTWHGAEELSTLLAPLDALTTLPGNPRIGNVDAVARSYQAFGQQKPIVVWQAPNGERHIVAGNHQWKAAKQLSWSHIATVEFAGSEHEARAFALADNRSHDLGKYDDDLLEAMLATIPEGLLDATGYEADYAPVGGVQKADDTSPAPMPGPTRSALGDVWLLGRHKVIVGDSSKAATWDAVDGEQAMLWTDPPYGVAYVGKTEEALEIANDNLGQQDLAALWTGVVKLALAKLRVGAAWWTSVPAGPNGLLFRSVLDDAGILRQEVIWVKNSLVLGHSDYHYQHEPIVVGWKPGGPHTPPPDRTQTSVWAIDRPSRSAEHPTMKPIELVARAIRNHTQPEETVVDPFAGSGTTLLAAEHEGRVATCIEIDPRYADVILRRWEEVTGLVAVRQ